MSARQASVVLQQTLLAVSISQWSWSHPPPRWPITPQRARVYLSGYSSWIHVGGWAAGDRH